MFKRSLISLASKRIIQPTNLIPLTSNLKFNTDEEFLSFLQKDPKNFSNYLLLLSNNIKNIKKKHNISANNRENLILSDNNESSTNIYRNIFYISNLLNENINLVSSLQYNSHTILGSLSSVGINISNHPHLCFELFNSFLKNSKNLSSDSIIKGLTSSSVAQINKEVITQEKMNLIFNLVENQLIFQSPDNIIKTLQALKSFGYSFTQLPLKIRSKIQNGFISTSNMFNEFYLKNFLLTIPGVPFSSFSSEFKSTFLTTLVYKLRPTTYLELSIIFNCLVSNNDFSLKNNITRADLNILIKNIYEEILLNPNRGLEAFHKLFHSFSISDISWDYLDESLNNLLVSQIIKDLNTNSNNNINYLYGISISMCEFSYKTHKIQEENKHVNKSELNNYYYEDNSDNLGQNVIISEKSKNYTLVDFQNKDFQESYFKAIFNNKSEIKTKEFNVFLKVISFFNVKFNDFSLEKRKNFKEILNSIYDSYSKDQISYLNSYLNKIGFVFNSQNVTQPLPSSSSNISPSTFTYHLKINQNNEFFKLIQTHPSVFFAYLKQLSQDIKENNSEKSIEELKQIVALLENNFTILNNFGKKVAFLLTCFLNDKNFDFINFPNLILHLYSLFTNNCDQLDEGAYVRCLRHIARLNLTRQAISNEDMQLIFNAFNKNLKKLSMNEFSKAIDSFYLMGYNFGHFPLEIRDKIQEIYIKNHENLNSYGHYSMIKTIARENFSSFLLNSKFLDKVAESFLNLMTPIQSLHLSYSFYYLVGLGKFPLLKEYNKDELNVLFGKLYQEILYNSIESFRVILSGLELTEFYFYDLDNDLREKNQNEFVRVLKKKQKDSLKYFYFYTISLQNLYIKGLNKKTEIEEIEKQRNDFYSDLTNYTLIDLHNKDIQMIYFDYYLEISEDKNFSLKEFNSFIKLLDLLELSSTDLPSNLLESLTNFIQLKKNDCHITQKLFFKKIVQKYSLDVSI